MTSMATPPLLKRLNEESVLRTIRAGAPISRAQISRRAGISKPTVSLALQALLDSALVLAVDLGARFLRGVLGDLAGRVRSRQDVELGGDADRALAAIVQLRDGL